MCCSAQSKPKPVDPVYWSKDSNMLYYVGVKQGGNLEWECVDPIILRASGLQLRLRADTHC